MSTPDPDYDLAIATYSAIYPRYEKAGLAGLTEPERVVFLAWQFVGEINNGGLRQFLSSPSGKHATEATSALEAVQMPYAASLLRRSLAAIPPGFVGGRDRVPTPCNEALNSLTDEFFGSAENPYFLIASFVRQHLGKSVVPTLG